MKKSILILLIASFFLSEAFGATTPSTQGSEFYFSFMRGRNTRAKYLTLLVSSPQDATIKLTNPQTLTTQTYSVTAGVVATIHLLYIAKAGATETAGTFTPTITAPDGFTYPLTDCYTVVPNLPQKMGYYVQAYKPGDPLTPIKVSIYASLAADQSFDVANVLPTNALGNEYYVVSRNGNNTGGDGASYWPSEALIVATENNTEIEITSTCILAGSTSTDIEKTFPITLNKGETYLIQASSATASDIGRNDLSGTRIKVKDDGGTNKCKKIAVFSGSQHGSGENSSGVNGDYEYEQLFPTHLWGNNFMVASTLTSSSDAPDVVRIVASKPCTQITINGGTAKGGIDTTLNQTEVYEYRLTSVGEGAFVTASKPVEVALFPTRQAGNAQGAPSMITIAPIEQYLNEITFAAAPGVGVTAHQVLITSLTSICEQTTLNGVTMNTANGFTWTPITSNTDYSTIITSISTGTSYTLVNNVAPTKGGVSAYIYGDGDKVGYGYSVGSATRITKTPFYLNGDPSVNSNNLAGVCVDKALDFQVDLPYTYSTIEWDFGDGTPKITTNSPINTISHSFAAAGTYSITMIVTKNFSDCYSSSYLQDTATASILIIDKITSKKDTTICKGASLKSSRTNESAFGGITPIYRWSNGAKTESISPTDDYGETKTYWVKTYDNNCHIFLDTIVVNITAKIENTLSSDKNKVCGDGGTQVTISATEIGPVTSHIMTANNVDITGNLSSSLQYSYNPTETTDFKFTSIGTCETQEKTISVIANPTFEVNITAKSDQFRVQNSLPSSGGAVTYTANVLTHIDITGFIYTWSPVKGNVSSFTDQVTKASNNIYTVLVKDQDELCSAKATSDAITLGKVTLTTLIDPKETSNVSFGKTDFITKEDISKNLGNYTITIFNRYGQKIATVGTEGWNGTSNGKVADAGVYFYVIQFNDINDKLQEIKGTVEVVK